MSNEILQAEIPFDQIEGLEESPMKDKFKNVESLVRAYDQLEKKIGHKRTIIPTDNSPQEDWDEFYKDMRPAEASDYNDLMDDLINEDQKTALGTAFHNNGLSKRQAKAIMDEVNKTLNTKFTKDYGQEGLDKAMEEFGDQASSLMNDINAIFGENFVQTSTDAPNNTIAMLAKAIQATRAAKDKEYGIKDPVKPKGGTATQPGATSQAEKDIAFYNACVKERENGTLTKERLKELEKQYNQ